MTDDAVLGNRLAELLRVGNAEGFVSLFPDNPDELRYDGWACKWFHFAAGYGVVGVLQYFHGRGVDVNEPGYTRFQEGAVNQAASSGHLDATRWLLDRGAVLNLTVDGHVRCFPLTGASSSGHLDVVKLVIERGADVNARWAGKTALDHAAEHGERAVYDYLYSVGGRYAEELTVRKSIARAVRLGESVELANLLDDHPEEFRRNNEPCVWLGRAAYFGSVGCLERLAERGADVNDPVGVGGPLATAAGSWESSTDAVGWLLDNGATLNTTIAGRPRCLALTAAASFGRQDMVELLLDRGAELNAYWIDHTVLDHAEAGGWPDLEEYLPLHRREDGGRTREGGDDF